MSVAGRTQSESVLHKNLGEKLCSAGGIYSDKGGRGGASQTARGCE